MALMLNIDTATIVCSVSLSRDGNVQDIRESFEKNIHASVITLFIQELLDGQGIGYKDLDAVAVSKGPGSYTGLRIGVATAKGICYAVDKPLVAVSTLKSLAYGASVKLKKEERPRGLLCPMIDARRMEVYDALFDDDLNEVRDIRAEIIDEGSFNDWLDRDVIYFFGDGAPKCKDVLQHPNTRFLDEVYSSSRFMAPLSESKFTDGKFEDLAYFEPFYLKDFIAGIPKVKGLR
jgi:tRNA threonylcarbamoyladenosine biosynthesis protein TsaB